jgi:hypothetical protein
VQAADVQSQTFNLVGVNEVDGLALMEVRCALVSPPHTAPPRLMFLSPHRMIGSSKKTGKRFDSTLFIVMELDTLSRKIKTLLLVNKNKAQAPRTHTHAHTHTVTHTHTRTHTHTHSHIHKHAHTHT